MTVISELLVKMGVDTSSIPGDMSGAKKAVLAGGVVIAAAAVASAKKLYDIGSVFDDVEDTIRVGTGATGKHLEALTKSADRVGASIPATFQDIGTTIADVNTRLGLTGPVLEKVTKQFLEAGRLTGEALDIKTFTGAFNAFDVQGKQIPKTLDDIYRVSQATGVGMNDLASSVGRNAPLLKQFDFSISDSAALLGTLDKAGLNGNKTVATLSKAMVTFAADGKKPRAALEQTIGKISEFTKSGKDAKAINLAASIFGTRGASQFVAAVKSGKVNLDDLMKGAGTTGDSIMKASKDTADFSEKWQVFKNRVMLKLKPLAAQVFNSLGKGMDKLNKSHALAKVTTQAHELIAGFREGKGVGGALATVLDGIRSTAMAVGPPLLTIVGAILKNKTAVLAIITALTLWKAITIANNVVQAVSLVLLKAQTVGTLEYSVVSKVAAAASKAWSVAQWLLNAALTANPIGLVVVAIAALAVGLVLAYKKSETFRAVIAKMGDGLAWLFGFIKKHWVLVGSLLLGPIFYAAVQIVKHWDKISGAVRGGISKVIGFVKGNWVAILATLVAGPFGLAVVMVVKHWDKITGAVRGGVSRVVGFVRSLPGKITGAIGDAGSILLHAGEDIISGLIHGIENKVGDLKGTLTGITGKITSWKGPPKKDRHLLTPAGRMIMAGLIDGLVDGEGPLEKKLGKITDAIGRALDNDRITKKAAKRMRATVDAVGKELGRLAKTYEREQGKLDSLIEGRKSMAASIADSVSGELDLGSLITTTEPNQFGFGGGVSGTTFGAVAGAVSGLAARAKRFAGKLRAMLKKGIPRGLVQEVAGLGTDQGTTVADALLSGTGAQVASLASDYADVSKYAGSVGDVIAGAFYDNRIKAQKALLAGLLEKPAIKKAAKSLAKSLTDELLASLGVHTPKPGKGKGGKGGGAGHRYDIDAAGRAVPVPRITPAQTHAAAQHGDRKISVEELAELLSGLGIEVKLGVDEKTATRIVRKGQQGAEKRG